MRHYLRSHEGTVCTSTSLITVLQFTLKGAAYAPPPVCLVTLLGAKRLLMVPADEDRPFMTMHLRKRLRWNRDGPKAGACLEHKASLGECVEGVESANHVKLRVVWAVLG